MYYTLFIFHNVTFFSLASYIRAASSVKTSPPVVVIVKSVTPSDLILSVSECLTN